MHVSSCVCGGGVTGLHSDAADRTYSTNIGSLTFQNVAFVIELISLQTLRWNQDDNKIISRTQDSYIVGS